MTNFIQIEAPQRIFPIAAASGNVPMDITSDLLSSQQMEFVDERVLIQLPNDRHKPK